MLSVSDALGLISDFDTSDADKFLTNVNNVVRQLSGDLPDGMTYGVFSC